MKHNTSPEFVGLEKLKEKQYWQLHQFIEWAEKSQWSNFHHAHYDWWMFPINKGSKLGKALTVYEYEIAELKKEKNFMHGYLLGAKLLMQAWGWDLYLSDHIATPKPDQVWHNWPIRLHKCATSLQLFEMKAEFDSVKRYGQYLINKGTNFHYNGRDLSKLFL